MVHTSCYTVMLVQEAVCNLNFFVSRNKCYFKILLQLFLYSYIFIFCKTSCIIDIYKLKSIYKLYFEASWSWKEPDSYNVIACLFTEPIWSCKNIPKICLKTSTCAISWKGMVKCACQNKLSARSLYSILCMLGASQLSSQLLLWLWILCRQSHHHTWSQTLVITSAGSVVSGMTLFHLMKFLKSQNWPYQGNYIQCIFLH